MDHLTNKQLRILLETRCREVADQIVAKALPGTGFLLMMFDFGDGGNMAYVSNAQRQDTIRLLREWLTKMEQSQ